MEPEQNGGGLLDWLERRIRGLDAGLVIEDGEIRQLYAGAGTTPSFWRDILVGVAVGVVVTMLMKGK